MALTVTRQGSSGLLQSYPASFRYFDLLLSAFVAVLLISNIVAPKIIAWGPFRFSGAQLLFPVTYIFGDIFTEVYGYQGSRRAIWNGFFASGLMAALSMLLVALPAAPTWPYQEAYATVLGFMPRLVIASLIAYWAGEFLNSFVMARMKVMTEGRHLWLRTIASTAVGQALDTVLVIVIAFAGVMSTSDLLTIIYSGYFGKVLYEAAATPLTYLVVNFLKKAEGIDIMDRNTDFNPFHGKLTKT
jgi:uncharacterized integral membrane protein (TIGR00697 family)